MICHLLYKEWLRILHVRIKTIGFGKTLRIFAPLVCPTSIKTNQQMLSTKIDLLEKNKSLSLQSIFTAVSIKFEYSLFVFITSHFFPCKFEIFLKLPLM